MLLMWGYICELVVTVTIKTVVTVVIVAKVVTVVIVIYVQKTKIARI